MMLDIVAEAALRAVVLAAVVQLGLWLFRIRHAQLLLVAWTVVLAASLAMPALQWATPLELPAFPTLTNPPPVIAAAEQASAPAFVADADPASSMILWAEAVYLLVGGTLLLRLAIGVALSLRLLAKAAPARLDWAEDARIRISRDVGAPVTVANIILLPPDVMDWPMAMRQAVLAHEHAHVARWDFAMLLASQVNRALFWFSPLSWWLHRRLVALAELASDDHALAVTGDRAGYAGVLLEMGRRSGPLLRGVAMARPAMLQYRIERILSDRARPDPVHWAQRLVLALGAACLSVAAASRDPSPAPPSDVTALAQLPSPPAPPDANPSPPVQAANKAPAPMPPQPAAFAGQQPAPSTPPAVAAPPRPAPAAHASARPIPHQVARAAIPVVLARQATRNGDARHVPEAPLGPEAARVGVRPRPNEGLTLTAASSRTPADDGPAPASHRNGHSPATEPPILKIIDQQTCNGVYLPGPYGGRYEPNWLNMVKARFFREADGRPWLALDISGQAAIASPVTVKGNEVEFTSSRNTVFTVLPKGMNHLTGTTQRPYGTVDIACGGSNAHLFDGAS